MDENLELVKQLSLAEQTSAALIEQIESLQAELSIQKDIIRENNETSAALHGNITKLEGKLESLESSHLQEKAVLVVEFEEKLGVLTDEICTLKVSNYSLSEALNETLDQQEAEEEISKNDQTERNECNICLEEVRTFKGVDGMKS